MSNLLKCKPLDMLTKEASETGEAQSQAGWKPVQHVTLGIGAIIGAGIFLDGSAAAEYAGPAIVLSFVWPAWRLRLAGFCYSEFASILPIAGSAYTYGYATLGEFFAWIIGWDLILEYALGAATVACGWSGYVVSFLQDFGISIPPQFPGHSLYLTAILRFNVDVIVLYNGRWELLTTMAPMKARTATELLDAARERVFNLVAPLATWSPRILVIGIKESANFNSVIVIIKLTIVLAIFRNRGHISVQHPALAGKTGILSFRQSGASMGTSGGAASPQQRQIFFPYIGFDAVSTAAQEAKNPQRDMPIGILGSLVICTILYILVSGLLTGMVPYTALNVADPVAVESTPRNPWEQ